MAKRRANGEGSIRKRKDGRWEGRYTAGRDPETGKAITKNVLARPRRSARRRCKRPSKTPLGWTWSRQASIPWANG